jgi:HEAT repeat protein
MHRALCVLACLILGLLGTDLAAPIQQSPEIRKLFAQLNEPSTTDMAAHQILEVAAKDATARQYIVRKLPDMIIKQKPEDEVWQNAVRLAGKLKSSEAIPSLLNALSLGPAGGPMNTTFGVQMRLEDDIVAKALSEIGDPAISAVERLLSNEDKKTRRRAVLILRNMDSPAARKVLQERLPHENDQIIKELIETGLSEPARGSPAKS